MGERQRSFSTVGKHSVLPCPDIFAVSDSVLLHRSATSSRRGIAVPRNSLTRCNARHLRIKRLVQFILVGAVYHNALTTCATLLCRACLDEIACVAEWYLTLRTGYERHGRKNPLPFPYFRSGHMSVICARLGSKGKVGVQRGRKTAGCPSFLLPPRGAATLPPRGAARSRRSGGESPAEVQRKTLRPERANPLTQFEHPGPPVQEKVPPIRGEPACGSSRAPLSRCRKGAAPSGRTR